LLAEDGLVSQRLIASLLRSADHWVTIANNGQEAFEIWQANTFDLVLMDVEMPELDGLAATQKIREVERSGIGRTPIIALTAHPSDEMHARCIDAGMDGVLVKPLRTDELYRVIDALG
jgi:CheY-like chemotaxis protein